MVLTPTSFHKIIYDSLHTTTYRHILNKKGYRLMPILCTKKALPFLAIMLFLLLLIFLSNTPLLSSQTDHYQNISE